MIHRTKKGIMVKDSQGSYRVKQEELRLIRMGCLSKGYFVWSANDKQETYVKPSRKGVRSRECWLEVLGFRDESKLIVRLIDPSGTVPPLVFRVGSGEWGRFDWRVDGLEKESRIGLTKTKKTCYSLFTTSFDQFGELAKLMAKKDFCRVD